MRARARVYVQDHSFVIGDGVDMPMELIDFSTGLAGVMPSTALIACGINSGTVTVIAEPADRQPEVASRQQWDEIADISLYAPDGRLSIHRLSYGPFDTPPDLPVMSPHGPGHYRLRIHARGRDASFDKDIGDSDEEYHLVSWPADPAPPLIIKTTDETGYGLRLSQLRKPTAALPEASPAPAPAASEQEALQRQSLLRSAEQF